MKRSIAFSLFTVSLVLALGSTGCKKKPVALTNIPGAGQTGRNGTGNNSESSGNLLNNENVVSANADGSIPLSTDRRNKDGREEREPLAAERIQFDLDSATIKKSEKPKLDKVAAYLKEHPDHDLLIEGHCDERGTEGYNLSLGEKRALAAREYLASVGANVNYVYTISYGEARPIEPLHSEDAFSKNRRGEFVVVLPAGK
jgi:peptidoglycan-associated lipoprotein